jgi:hypothetical protein
MLNSTIHEVAIGLALIYLSDLHPCKGGVLPLTI